MESQPDTAPSSKGVIAKSERLLCPYIPESSQPRPSKSGGPMVVLTGNPNCGKTTLFNALTGLRARVGNYPGVTVERKEGRLLGAPFPVVILDLPGTYSLTPQSPDEQIARDALFHRLTDVPRPELVIVVVDASNLERNLYFATQVIELEYRTLIALNMVDVAEENGHHIDAGKLERFLGAPVFAVAASSGRGVGALRQGLLEALGNGARTVRPSSFVDLGKPLLDEEEALARVLEQVPGRTVSSRAEALLLLTSGKVGAGSDLSRAIQDALKAARSRLEKAGIDWRGAAIEARYARVSQIRREVTTESRPGYVTASEKADRYMTHRFWGLLIFVAVMGSMFMAIFTLARLPMEAIQAGISALGDWTATLIPPGELQNLVVNGIIQGVGSVVVFLPQICLLFLFIGLLEDTGYMSRAAFLMDRLMGKAGLHGRSFIPMLSSFACAIPGIMAARTIDSPKDRLVTILVAPLMSCSARLPVYVLLIAACFPGKPMESAGIMLSMYVLGIVAALGMASLFKKTLLKGETPILIMELPPYKRPMPGVILRHIWDPAKMFLWRAGTVILGVNILLWFLTVYPKPPKEALEHFTARRAAIVSAGRTEPYEPGIKGQMALSAKDVKELESLNGAEASLRLESSFAGSLGRAIEPGIAPLGFDWKIGIGLISSFAAREMFVSTMAVVYNVSPPDEETRTRQLAEVMREQKRPDGTRLYSTLTTVTLLVFYALALQCASTMAVVRRETGSWRWPIFQWCYMGALAWGLAFAIRHAGLLLGFQ